VYPDPLEVPVDPEFSGYLGTVQSMEWIDLGCGCKVSIPSWTISGTWTVVTDTQMSIQFEKAEDPWKYWMPCPCGDYALFYNKEQYCWGWMEVGEEE